MNKFLHSESWFMLLIHRFSTLVVLNILFLFTCIPVFTIGAALTAMYDVVFRMDTAREGKLAATYFHSFGANFRHATPIWLFFLLIMAASWVNAQVFSAWDSIAGHMLSLVAMVILINTMLVLGYVFPLLSQFENTKTSTLKNALLLSIANLPRTLIIAVINCFPWALMLVNFYTFIQISFLWLVLYFAAAAYFNSRVLMKVFSPLREQASSDK